MDKITPRVDLAFKKIFGVEENKDLLISLINSIVGQEDQVAEITLLNPYNPKNFKKDKLSILDIKAKSVDGKRFNIEIQISDEADYDKRALYYWAKLYTEQLKIAEDYSLLSKAIGIHILNFTSIPSVDKYHNVFHIVEKDSGLVYFKDLELHTIELNKFTKNSQEELPDIVAKVKNSLDMWTAFLTRHDLLNKDNLPKELDNASLKKALTVLGVMNFTDEEREAYEDHLKWLRIEANTLKKQLEKGRVEERIAIARKLLKENMTSEHIANITSLSIEEINKLLK
ncbi:MULTISPECIES: Rpn family recombination-promoting nuclease/putative transposase [unclassified Candidatus Tisiphia]|uniref:Rpn family recombination-promoting nuclease/putative transposase n=1 Tax=unclassified Candidatus Tisiphia TaxID=2996318 RepID=UPI00312C6D23|nr:Rpn family recombination-promoting nuclease/putative transposase [Rickettsiaceae bacterium]MDD9337417.1 Rpn family recombination-promoting nuclease/putative transposase [Rickettsiaceae bacterium]